MMALHGAEYVDGKGHKDNFIIPCRLVDNISERQMIYGCVGPQYYILVATEKTEERCMAGHSLVMAWCKMVP